MTLKDICNRNDGFVLNTQRNQFAIHEVGYCEKCGIDCSTGYIFINNGQGFEEYMLKNGMKKLDKHIGELYHCDALGGIATCEDCYVSEDDIEE